MVAGHLEWCRLRNLRPGTINQRGYALQRLARAHGDPIRCTPEQVAAHLARPTLDAEARATELSHLRQFYKWAILYDHRRDDPTAKIMRPRLPRRLPRPTGEDDLAVAVTFAPARIRPWLILAAWGGLRCAEIGPLRVEHVMLDTASPLVLIEEAKGGDVQAQPLGRWAAGELLRCDLPCSGWLFPRGDGKPGPTPAHRVSQLGNQYLRSMGIPSTMHQLRHRYGTVALRTSGGDLRKTQELMRHRSPNSTQRYTWMDRTELAAVADAIPAATWHPTLFEAG